MNIVNEPTSNDIVFLKDNMVLINNSNIEYSDVDDKVKGLPVIPDEYKPKIKIIKNFAAFILKLSSSSQVVSFTFSSFISFILIV